MESSDTLFGAVHGTLGTIDVDINRLFSCRGQHRDFFRSDFHEAAGHSDKLFVPVGTIETHTHGMRQKPRYQRSVFGEDTQLTARGTDDKHADVLGINHFIRGDNL